METLKAEFRQQIKTEILINFSEKKKKKIEIPHFSSSPIKKGK